MAIRCALAGNPNSGKTTLFNLLTGSTAHVGNWPGVTVERKEGIYKKGDAEIQIIDLPGIYSLSPYSPEEQVASDFLKTDAPDVIINIVDATNIERNLYLTTQLSEVGVPVVVALNMMDEVEQRGDKIDVERLSAGLGLPVIPIVATKKTNVDALMNRVKAASKEGAPTSLLSPEQKKKLAAEHSDADEREAMIADLRYRAIGEVVANSVAKHHDSSKLTRSDKIDKVLTHRIWALPIFVLIMLLVFQLVFGDPLIPGTAIPSPGVWLQGGMETLIGWLTDLIAGGLEAVHAAEWAQAIVIGGVMEGVGSVLSFVPQILMLFLFLSILEGSGYMSRVAFIMDRICRRFGLSGKAFVPMLMGFGCSVPAIMATRTLENDNDRKMTMILTPFMSCGAKLPIYTVFVGALFPRSGSLVIASLYFLGIIVAVFSGILLKKFLFKGQAAPFIMELPQYRMPTLRNVFMRMWEKGKDFVIRAGTIILVSVIVISLLQTFNWQFQVVEDAAESILGTIGNAIKFIFIPNGFPSWQAAVAILTGFLAKENVVATLGALFGAAEEAEEKGLAAAIAASGVFTPLSAYAYMVFNLLAMPCMAAVGTLRKEMNSWKWTLFAVLYQTGVAYILSMLIFRIGSLIL